MKSATLYPQKIFVAVTVLSLALALGINDARASAGSPQQCTVAGDCTIGEYLYDDEYAPITTADICDLNAKYPDGTAYLTDQNMPPAAQNDGWYSYTFTTPATTGYYRAEVCCTVNSEKICVDKSFESLTASEAADADTIAASVWGYSNRTLSNFGNLISDIWGYSSRTLTGFGTLVSDIWNHNPSTTSTTTNNNNVTNNYSTTNNTVINQINETKRIAEQNRALLDRIVNQPEVSYFWEDEAPDLSSKLKETETHATQLFVNNQYISSKVALLIKNWNKTSQTELLDTVIELNELMGEEGENTDANTVYGSLNWIKTAWDWQENANVEKALQLAKQNMTAVQTNLASSKNLTSANKEAKNLLGNLAYVDKAIGGVTDSSSEATLYGKIKQTEEIVAVLDTEQKNVEHLLANWSAVKADSKTQTDIQNLKREILAVNKVPKGSYVLSLTDKSKTGDIIAKNSLLSMRGLVIANKFLLSKGAGDYLANAWLEEGSIVIKTMVTNPSKLTKQEADIKYYLPPEVREEDILSVEEPLKVTYDIEKDQNFIEGKVALAANETKVLKITLTDIWVISQDEVDSLRKQATEFSKPLEGTSYFAQGVTLKADIESSLDKIVLLQKDAITPAQRIRAFRDAMIEKRAVDEKLSKLGDLVVLASASGNLFGFIGGTQALAVWGLILVMITGFVFLILYMKKMTGGDSKKKSGKGKGKMDKPKSILEPRSTSIPALNINRLARLAGLFLIFGALIATLSGFIVAKIVSSNLKKEYESKTAVPQQLTQVLGEEKKPEVEVKKEEEESMGGREMVKINVPVGKKVNLRSEPSLTAEVVLKLSTSIDAVKLGEAEGFVNIAVETEIEGETKEGWISNVFVTEQEKVVEEVSLKTEEEEKPAAEEQEVTGEVTILDTPTGWLRVRTAPGGSEIGKVLPGEEYPVISQSNDWFEIELEEGKTGFVSSKYASMGE